MFADGSAFAPTKLCDGSIAAPLHETHISEMESSDSAALSIRKVCQPILMSAMGRKQTQTIARRCQPDVTSAVMPSAQAATIAT